MSLASAARPASQPPLAAAAQPDEEIRVYRARTIEELIPRIEAELGADAIVVHRRKGLEGGIGGFFRRAYVEVQARRGTPGIDVYDESPAQPQAPAAPLPASVPAPVPAPAPAVAHAPVPAMTGLLAAYAANPSEDAANTVQTRTAEANTMEIAVPEDAHSAVVQDPPLPAAEPPATADELTSETFAAALVEAERAQELMAPEASVTPETSVVPAAVPSSPAPVRPSPPEALISRAPLMHNMLAVGVSEELAQELIDAAVAHVLPFAPRIGLANAVREALIARIPRAPLLPSWGATVAVIGPGGSGKTSCCAALMGNYRRAGTLPTSCATITLLGERLQEPAILLSPQIMAPQPLSSLHARQALSWAREGLLLLDMPPLSAAERAPIRRMANILGELQPDRVVVALPATLGARAAAQLLEALAPLGATAMAITHADETDQIGVAVEAACRFGLAPEYLLDRGRVRGGLTRIDPTQLADRLLP